MKKIISSLCIFLLLHISTAISAQGIINNNADITVGGSAYITIEDGSFINNGTFSSGSGTVAITGTAATAQSLIGGTSVSTFNNLSINKSANAAALSANINVNGNLDMLSGNLDLSGHNIDLGSGPGIILNEKKTSRITGTAGGTVIKTVTLNAPNAINPGNIGIAISSSANLGTTIITRSQQPQSGTGSGQSIARYFDIAPANNASLDATLKIYYFDGELNGATETDLNLWKSEDGGSTWAQAGKDANDAANNWVQKNNIDQLSRWTLANAGVLPVSWLYFSAALKDNQTLLSWATAQEINTDHFDVERATDPGHFSYLDSKKAHGTSFVNNYYHDVDAQPLPGINYYRIRQVDKDGSAKYSNIAHIQLPDNYKGNISLYPNPAHDKTYITFKNIKANKCVINLYNEAGKLLQRKEVFSPKGYYKIEWNTAALIPGIYFIRVEGAQLSELKLIKQ